MKIDWAIKTDTGRVRTQNEDAARIEPATGLAVLCDGMGGHRAGEVASRLAVETFFDSPESTDPIGTCPELGDAPPVVPRLVRATWAANEAVFAKAECEEACRGMGCTLVALRLTNDTASFATVGDSRIYLYRAGTLHRISQDHTRLRMLEQMGIHLEPKEARQIQGILVRALGTQPTVEVDFGYGPALEGDLWLLCSDGLTDEVDDERIASVLDTTTDAASTVESLVHIALDAGGKDNITIAIARIVSGMSPTGDEKVPRPETCSPHVDPEDSDPGEERSFLSRLSRRIRGGQNTGDQDGDS